LIPWFNLKQFLRAAKTRTAETLDQTITEAPKTITADNAAAWLRHCGYAIIAMSDEFGWFKTHLLSL
jgi:hypothetical protein